MFQRLLLVSGLICFGLLDSFASFQSGELYLKNGDTIKCEISVYKANVFITPWKSGKITYRIGEDKVKIDMTEVFALQIGNCRYENHTLPIVAYVMRGGNKVKKIKMINYFVHVVVDGDSQLLEHYYLESSGGGTMNGVPMPYHTYLTSDYYINGQGGISKISRTIFKKTIKQKYPDCPEVLGKVKRKEFKYENIIEVIQFANSNCKATE